MYCLVKINFTLPVFDKNLCFLMEGEAAPQVSVNPKVVLSYEGRR